MVRQEGAPLCLGPFRSYVWGLVTGKRGWDLICFHASSFYSTFFSTKIFHTLEFLFNSKMYSPAFGLYLGDHETVIHVELSSFVPYVTLDSFFSSKNELKFTGKNSENAGKRRNGPALSILMVFFLY